VLYPIGQQARNEVRGYGLVDTVKESARFIGEHFGSYRGFQEMLSAEGSAPPEQDAFNYYAKPIGLVERLSLIKMVDLLITATLEQGTLGWETVTHGFKMMVPRAIYPNKPVWNTGQLLAHKVGMLAEDDESTQVSFGFVADGFSAFGWWGAWLIPFFGCLVFFLVYQFLVGPLERNLWGIYFAVQLQHAFTEATIASLTLMSLLNPLSYVVLYLAIERLTRSEMAQALWQGPLRRLALRPASQAGAAGNRPGSATVPAF
jgi:hypothetical protein